ncbi:PmoA family protein [Rubrolithibacter danxiaensis]|uniref:DUF6807 domain-containing protein n=1 Tax=Rubrolithibacter danxiaensis TaxID=3390805 RepID=UPI003BF892FF
MKKIFLKTLRLAFLLLFIYTSTFSQDKKVSFQQSKDKVDVIIDGRLFTSFLYPDTLEKPILYPINTADNLTITRGFPIKTRTGERTDHPHHQGMWFTYENVNSIDFWNNSYAIPAEKKSAYGWIRNTKIESIKNGSPKGSLTYTANWEKQDKTVLLKEKTILVFSGTANSRTIDRVTTLTAQKDTVHFYDAKDALLGLRVTKELELPSDKPEQFSDIHGNITTVSPKQNGATGNYLTSEGKTGDDAWGTRANWCLLSGIINNEPVSVAIIDNPANPGYPAYWHARGYGLFAVNPLGQKIFSNGKEVMNLTLQPGQSVTFRYRVLITSGKKITAEELNKEAAVFSSDK